MRRLFVIITVLCMVCQGANAGLLDPAAQISNLTDFNLGTWGIGDPAISASIDVCVYSVYSTTSGGYTVQASNPDGFVLTKVGGTAQIPYSAYWDDGGAGNLGPGTGTQLTNNSTLTARAHANISSPLCASGVVGPDARLNIKITQAAMNAALAGTYNGTISILVAPN